MLPHARYPHLPFVSTCDNAHASDCQFSFMCQTTQGVGSTLFYMSRCRVFSSRLHREQLAISFSDHATAGSATAGGAKVLMLEAATQSDAYEWIVAIASCLYFSSSSFERLLRGSLSAHTKLQLRSQCALITCASFTVCFNRLQNRAIFLAFAISPVCTRCWHHLARPRHQHLLPSVCSLLAHLPAHRA